MAINPDVKQPQAVPAPAPEVAAVKAPVAKDISHMRAEVPAEVFHAYYANTKFNWTSVAGVGFQLSARVWAAASLLVGAAKATCEAVTCVVAWPLSKLLSQFEKTKAFGEDFASLKTQAWDVLKAQLNGLKYNVLAIGSPSYAISRNTEKKELGFDQNSDSSFVGTEYAEVTNYALSGLYYPTNAFREPKGT